jgi:hypothetical protein
VYLVRFLEAVPPALRSWAKGEQLTDKALRAAVHEIENGLIDARLGGFLLKKWIAKDHKGKSGGLRTIIAYRQGSRLVFIFRFAKRDQASLEDDEKKALHKLGDVYMAKSETQADELVKKQVLLEVHCDGKE